MMFVSVSLGIPFHEVRQWSAAELTLYQVYYRMQPWGDVRADLRAANQTASIVSASGAKKEGGGRFTIDDFMLKFGKPEKDETGAPAGLREALMSASRLSRKKK